MTRTVLLLALAIAGCTTASTTMLSDSSALIAAKDLNTGSPKEVRKKALLTAAQTAQARGYEYFGIVSLEERSSQGWVGTTGRMGLGGGGPDPFGSIPTRDLHADMTVRFLHASELPADRDGIYQTSAVLAQPK